MIKTHASLFSGIGAAEIAADWMGWQNAFHCEIQEFPRRVLDYWYPNSVSYEDITKTDFTPWRGKIDILTAGFPCQPFSCAGQRKGADDDRYLWPEALRAVCEIQPSWFVGENVVGLISMVQPGEEAKVGRTDALFQEDYIYRKEQRFTLDEICEGLERAGYAVQPFVIPACAVGAPHRRDRIWIVAHRNDAGLEEVRRERQDGVLSAGAASDTYCDRQRHGQGEQEPITERERTPDDSNGRKDEASSDAERCGGREMDDEIQPRQPNGQGTYGNGRQRPAADTGSRGRYACELHHGEPEEPQQAARRAQQPLGTDCPQDWWRDFPTQSPVCSRDDELSARLAGITFPRWRAESIKALGNAMVPAVVYEIFRAIRQVENEKQEKHEGDKI